MTRLICGGLALACAVLVSAPAAQAVDLASDKASNAAYAADLAGAWTGQNPSLDENPPGNDNGGTGFLPWDFGGGFHIPSSSPYGNLNHFIDGVDFPASTYNNLGGPAFGLTTSIAPYFGTYATAKRPFALPLATGNVFSADFDTPSVYTDLTGTSYPFAIISFRDASNAETLVIEAGSSLAYGDFNWRYTDLTHSTTAIPGAIAPTATSDGSSIKVAMTSGTAGRVTFDGVQFDVDFKAGAPAAVVFALSDNSSGDGATDPNVPTPNGQHEFFFNNLKITSGVSIPGDFDGNGNVNAADLVQWRGDYGINGDSNADGDADSDGNDFLVWQRNLGAPGAGVNVAAVPEPATGIMTLATVAMLAAARRRRSKRDQG